MKEVFGFAMHHKNGTHGLRIRIILEKKLEDDVLNYGGSAKSEYVVIDNGWI